eukprot:TRINITY_DN13103_c0_g1_i3.p1 TRINITY_DN13103_c0_g1~~TRINITY_DN13103_c0_g1_i3.p1  ORF type:complete len:123 (-),score=21.05 TRINITY_DN13103_c0_g1_i3:473-841(-)
MTTFGSIKPARDGEGRDVRLAVTFTGGNLRPADGTDAETQKTWLRVFSDAQANRKRSLPSMLKNGLMRLMMGLKLPEAVAPDGTVSFHMSKPPHGFTDILFIDEELRVTRGNRGSVVVVIRG